MNYLEMKERAVTATENCLKFAQTSHNKENAKVLSHIHQVLKDGKLVIMAIGEARTGKSSLLGCYLNDPSLFPVDVDVTTCLITMVAYGETEKVTVVVADEKGRESAETITRDSIPLYAKEQNNPHGSRRASMILIETPNEVLRDGLVFMDSPGLGSMNPLHSQLTYQFLPRADVVLFITDSTSQISESELQFLQSVRRSCENILFVLTKSDLLEDPERILRENRQMIQKHIGIAEEKQIHIPVSSRMLLAYQESGDPEDLADSNIAAFDQALWNLISQRRVQATILPRLLEAQREMQQMEQGLIVSETVCSNNSVKIASMQKSLKEQKQKKTQLLQDRTDWEDAIRLGITNLGENLSSDLTHFSQETRSFIAQALEQNRYKRDPNQLANEVVGMMQQQMRHMEELAEDAASDLRDKFKQKSGLDLIFDERELSLDMTEEVTLKKRSGYDQAMAAGKKIRNHSFGLGGIGGVVGGVVGGIAGFVTLGPPGAAVGAAYGSSVGTAAGVGIGSIAGTISVAKEGVKYDPQNVRRSLEEYITNTTKMWDLNKRRYLNELTSDLKKSCRNAVQKNLEAIQNNLDKLVQVTQILGSNQQKQMEQVRSERQAFDAAASQLSELIRLISADAPSAPPPEALQAPQNRGRAEDVQ